MKDKHARWRPSPAAKPAHLASTTTNQSAAHLAALRGATTAFASSTSTNSPTVKNVSQHHDGLFGSAGQDDKRGRSYEGEKEAVSSASRMRSRSRGRHLSPEDAQLAGARSAVVSANNSPRPSPPASLDRSPSMIAARLVSTSPSPVRSSISISPSNEAASMIDRRTRGTEPVPPKSGLPTARPLPQQAQQNKTQATVGKPLTVNIDFERLPKLAPVASAPPQNAKIREPDERDTDHKPLSGGSLVRARTPLLQSQTGTDPYTSTPEEGSLGARADQLTHRLKPPAPAPRRGRAPAVSPLRPSLTGPKPGETREEAISRMADAMVASSIASSRPPSPTKPYKAHGLRRRSASVHDLYKLPRSNEGKIAVQPKPVRPMKQTLRKHSSENEDDGTETTKRGRRHLVRKHPNMHHEGDRKRWRDKVTELERKRYEGVFAANRGLLLKSGDKQVSPSRILDPTSEGNMVVNVVVRDIWERSRLPSHILEQIYDLVAPEEPLLLNREQFVVGLWLIDQKLKGRKLPVRVSPSVWASVRHLQGIKLGKAS